VLPPRSTSCLDGFHASPFPYPGPVPLQCCSPPRMPRLLGALLGRHLAVAVESSLQNPRALSFARLSTTRAPTSRSPGSSGDSRTLDPSFTVAPSSSIPAARARCGQPLSTAHCSHRPSSKLLQPRLELPSPQSLSNFGRSTVADNRRPPPSPARRGQPTSAIPAPRQPLSQSPFDPVKLYDPSIGPLVHHTGFPMCAGDLHPPPLSAHRGTPLSGPSRP
jgi:hypothetical protein